MKVQSFACNPFQENCYVVWDDDTRHCLIVDPGMSCEKEWNRLHDFLTDNGLTPERILLTHCHSDHVLGIAYLTRAYPNLPVCGSVEDQNHLPSVQEQCEFFGIGDVEIHWSPVTQDLKEGDTLTFPTKADEQTAATDTTDTKPATIQVLDCPGHSFHGLCFYFPAEKLLFSGDVLFYCSIGRSDFGPAMGGNGRQLVENIVTKLLVLPQDVTVCPGHGPKTSIGIEATYNPYL